MERVRRFAPLIYLEIKVKDINWRRISWNFVKSEVVLIISERNGKIENTKFWWKRIASNKITTFSKFEISIIVFSAKCKSTGESERQVELK
jgi:hypothetical protein